jgi:hypothetical protein
MRQRPPRFTDMSRYPSPYRDSQNTDITRSWQRAKDKLEADRKEREEKVKQLRQLGGKR